MNTSESYSVHDALALEMAFVEAPSHEHNAHQEQVSLENSKEVWFFGSKFLFDILNSSADITTLATGLTPITKELIHRLDRVFVGGIPLFKAGEAYFIHDKPLSDALVEGVSIGCIEWGLIDLTTGLFGAPIAATFVVLTHVAEALPDYRPRAEAHMTKAPDISGMNRLEAKKAIDDFYRDNPYRKIWGNVATAQGFFRACESSNIHRALSEALSKTGWLSEIDPQSIEKALTALAHAAMENPNLYQTPTNAPPFGE